MQSNHSTKLPKSCGHRCISTSIFYSVEVLNLLTFYNAIHTADMSIHTDMSAFKQTSNLKEVFNGVRYINSQC